MKEIIVSHSGQQHLKADNGGQRPEDAKKANEKSAEKGSTKEAIDAGKSPASHGAKDAKQ